MGPVHALGSYGPGAGADGWGAGPERCDQGVCLVVGPRRGTAGGRRGQEGAPHPRDSWRRW